MDEQMMDLLITEEEDRAWAQQVQWEEKERKEMSIVKVARRYRANTHRKPWNTRGHKR